MYAARSNLDGFHRPGGGGAGEHFGRDRRRENVEFQRRTSVLLLHGHTVRETAGRGTQV